MRSRSGWGTDLWQSADDRYDFHQEYYEGAYERLIEKDVPFYALDISGLKWIEIDTSEDFDLGINIFGNKKTI